MAQTRTRTRARDRLDRLRDKTRPVPKPPEPMPPIPVPPKPLPPKPLKPLKPKPLPPKPLKPQPGPPIPEGVEALTQRILELERRASSHEATSRAELGRLLIEVQTILPTGAWLSWLESAVPFTPRTATNYLQLHLFAKDNPAAFERLTVLGAFKLYVIMRLDRRPLGVLLRRKLHPIPGTNDKRPLEALTYPQLVAVIAALLGEPSTTPEPLAAFEKKVQAVTKAVASLIEDHPDLDPQSLAALHQSLVTAAADLAAAFDLPT